MAIFWMHSYTFFVSTNSLTMIHALYSYCLVTQTDIKVQEE